MKKNKEVVNKYFIIKDLSFSDFMKDEEGNIKLYDTYQEAGVVCGMYEFEDTIICQALFNHIEDEPRFDFTAQFPKERFEYLKIKKLKENDLESLGNKGWEMCGVNDNTFFFKRKILTIREATLEVADIRNKLSPLTNLISLLNINEELAEKILTQQDWDTTLSLPFNQGFIQGLQYKSSFVDQNIKQSKKSINYLAQRNVYDEE